MPRRQVADIFILSAFDRDQWCPVLEARFRVSNLDVIRRVLGECVAGDPEIGQTYLLDEEETASLAVLFAADFQPSRLACTQADVFLFRPHDTPYAPYLIHTGYELPLLLDGRKKLARMSHETPPSRFDGEDRFDHWVSAGALKKVEVNRAFDSPAERSSGVRTVYYTPVGEEWRVSAMRMLPDVASKSGGWNEHFERLEGTLFGYGDADNDWWIAELRRQRGAFGGVGLCAAVGREDLAWIETVGFRALPPEKSSLDVMVYLADATEQLDDLLTRDPANIAVVLFCISAREATEMIDFGTSGPWTVPGDEIPRLNLHLRGPISIVMRKPFP